jgi:hypothetical protein
MSSRPALITKDSRIEENKFFLLCIFIFKIIAPEKMFHYENMLFLENMQDDSYRSL